VDNLFDQNYACGRYDLRAALGYAVNEWWLCVVFNLEKTTTALDLCTEWKNLHEKAIFDHSSREAEWQGRSRLWWSFSTYKWTAKKAQNLSMLNTRENSQRIWKSKLTDIILNYISRARATKWNAQDIEYFIRLANSRREEPEWRMNVIFWWVDLVAISSVCRDLFTLVDSVFEGCPQRVGLNWHASHFNGAFKLEFVHIVPETQNILEFLKSVKTHRARSGEYGGCGMRFVWYSVNALRILLRYCIGNCRNELADFFALCRPPNSKIWLRAGATDC